MYSSDPIEEALRVVGSLYGVRIEVSANETRAVTEVVVPSRRGSRGSSRPRVRAQGGATARTPRKRSTRASAATPTADLRVWARENGHSVNDRGPLPAEVLAAYTAAH